MPENPNSHNNGTKRYPPELKERAVRMVLETIEKTGERSGAVSRIARQLGIGDQSLRNWVAQAEGASSGAASPRAFLAANARSGSKYLGANVRVLEVSQVGLIRSCSCERGHGEPQLVPFSLDIQPVA
jgi:transposase-like protein